MGRYRGWRAADGAAVAVSVPDGGGGEERPLRPDIGALGYDWGKANEGAKRLAVALLAMVIPDDNHRIVRVYMRFTHRTVATWSAPTWSIDDDAIRRVVEDIERVERETSQTRRMAIQQPAPVANEGGADVTWTKRQMPTPNIPGRKQG